MILLNEVGGIFLSFTLAKLKKKKRERERGSIEQEDKSWKKIFVQ